MACCGCDAKGSVKVWLQDYGYCLLADVNRLHAFCAKSYQFRLEGAALKL